MCERQVPSQTGGQSVTVPPYGDRHTFTLFTKFRVTNLSNCMSVDCGLKLEYMEVTNIRNQILLPCGVTALETVILVDNITNIQGIFDSIKRRRIHQ